MPPPYYEVFIESGVECYEDSSDCDGICIFRAEDDNRIVGIGFCIESLRR